MLVSPEQLEKAYSPMAVTGFPLIIAGISTEPPEPVYFIILILPPSTEYSKSPDVSALATIALPPTPRSASPSSAGNVKDIARAAAAATAVILFICFFILHYLLRIICCIFQ